MPSSEQLGLALRSPRLLAISVLLLLVTTVAGSLYAQAPADPNASPPKNDAAQPAPPPPSDATAEVTSHDTATTFKVRVNLVLVHVVVRDAQGNVVRNLKKEDFQLLDNRKPQVISSFSVETPESHAVAPAAAADSEPSATQSPAGVTALPGRFVNLVFDDIDMLSEDAANVRDAASRLFGSLAPTDRVAIYSTSGQITQDFTSDHDLLNRKLLGIIPRPVAKSSDCPEISYYQADQIINYSDTEAFGAATEDAVVCAFQGDETKRAQAAAMVTPIAQQVLSIGDSQTEYVYRHLEDAMRRLAAMPGQRVMVFVSPGFILTKDTHEESDLIDRANRSNIVINTIDARGLYTPQTLSDIANPPTDSRFTVGPKSRLRIAAQSIQSGILDSLADGTGSTFFHNRNDLDHGLQLAVASPPLSYLLGFSPQNLKIDGRYHTLKVALSGKEKYSLQARHGYYAPRTIADPAEAAKEEIREALFSQEEIHDLPIELQTQFFKADQTQARLAVLTHVDLNGLHFRKADGRSRDDLTLATAIFDENGNFVIGGEKIVEMRLLDSTLNRLSHSGGFTVKSSFDIKPGTYLVRQVIRDAEGAQMAARNGAVVIPY